MAVEFLEHLIATGGMSASAITLGGDAIIAEGSNANGQLTLFAGGVMLCSGSITLGATNINNASGALYRSSQLSLVFAAAFTEPPVVTTYIPNGFLWALASAKTSSGLTFFLHGTTSSTGLVGIIVDYIAIGRWK